MDEHPSRIGLSNRAEIVGLTRAGVVTAVIAAILNVVVILIAQAFIDLPTDIAALQLTQVIVASVVPAIGATVVYGLLRRYTASARRNLLVVSTVVLTLSFLGYANFEPGATGTPGAIPSDPALIINTLIVLSMIHVLTAAVIVAGLTELTDWGVEA